MKTQQNKYENKNTIKHDNKIREQHLKYKIKIRNIIKHEIKMTQS